MHAYRVTLQETLQYEVTVEAWSVEEAEEKAEEKWRDEKDPEGVFGYEVVKSIAAVSASPVYPQDAEVNAQVDASIAKGEPPF